MNTEEKNIPMTAECVERIAQGIFQAQPLMKKRLAKLSAIQSEQGIPLSHVQVLAMLEEVGSMSVSEISKRFGIAKPNITPLLDALYERGLLERCRSDKDRRIVNVRLCEEGRALTEKIKASISTQMQEWPEGFSHSDVKRLNNALAYLIEVGNRLAVAERK